LRLAVDGKLVTQDGYPLRTIGGGSLTVQSGRPFDIAADGTVRQDGNVIGQLELADFTNAAGLRKQGSNYFRPADPNARVAANAAIEQGRLEGSNSGSAEASVRLVSVMRQFEMLQRAATLGGEMNRSAIEQVAKVGS
jgi:flagellar basal body rod protein FlgG